MKKIICVFAAVLVYGIMLHADVFAADDAAVNPTCPVMVGNKINPKIFVEYNGKKVYFCCPDCEGIFAKNPEKYLPLLPQFAAQSQAPAPAPSLRRRLVKPTGMMAFTFLCLTVCAGLFMRLKPALLFRMHKILAAITAIFALTHALLIILPH